MEQVVEEIKMSTYLEVPRLFWIILDGVADVLIDFIGMGNLHIATR